MNSQKHDMRKLPIGIMQTQFGKRNKNSLAQRVEHTLKSYRGGADRPTLFDDSQ